METLAIDRSHLTALPEWVRGLTQLRQLFLFGNSLSSLPSWLGELSHLAHLDVSNNLLRELPETLGKLKKLKFLALASNRLSSLPTALGQLSSLENLFIGDNPGLDLPTEILEARNAHRILDYYFRIRAPGAAQPLNEFKLILVGRGGVGKTTLVHRLVKNKYKHFKRTPGIKITKWLIPLGGEQVSAHVWDFGGQEIMHGTHRFFMTERSLYVVLISGREGMEDRDAEYWLSMVRSFAGIDVPLIVVLHKWDDYQFELNRELLREKYGRDIVFLEADSSSGYGVEALRDRICYLADKLPGLKAAWPVEWRRIKEELPHAGKSWLTFDEFCAFCRARGIEERNDQEALSESLHDLGLMLAFRKEEALRGFGVLNPRWATKGIYELLNARALRQAAGEFTVGSFAAVLPAKEYPKALHPYLLALMRKFRLCHPLDDKGEKYLIPELLTKEEPKLDAEFPADKCAGFIYRYDSVLPEGLLPRFIVETYVHREPQHVWRTGVVLQRANSRALVRGDVLGRAITIRVIGIGNSRRELLGIVREHFERIHQSFEKLPVTELVPVKWDPLITVPHAELIDYEAAGDDEYKVVIDRKPVKLSVKALLDGVDMPGAPRGKAAEDMTVFKRERLEKKDSLSLFISYSHRDELFRDELRGALTAYERKGEIISWDDTRIVAGQKWEPEILRNLERADIVVLLLSNDFIRSDYCYLKEMERALERDAAGECAIVPIVVRACPFTKLELGKIQAIQPSGKPIKQHKDRDLAWLAVTRQIDRVIKLLRDLQQKK